MKTKLFSILMIFLLSIYLVLPNFVQSSYLPFTKLNLGLDIRGGSSILLEADLLTHKREQMLLIKESVLRKLSKNIPTTIENTLLILHEVIPKEQIIDILNGILNERFYSINYENGNTLCQINHQYFESEQQGVLNRIIDVIRYRIDATGIQEISIQKQGKDSILVQIPGASNRSDIQKILSQTGSLKMHFVNMNVSQKDIAKNDLPLGVKVLPLMDDGTNREILVPISMQPIMYGEMIANAQQNTHMGKHIVSFKLTDAGTKKFAEVTKNNVGKTLAIVLDNKVITAPTINEPILTGSGQISGNFTFESAKQIAILLRSGSLPVPVKIVQENLIGPTLGKEAVESGSTAVIIGCLAVVFIMIAVYKGLGLIASIGLICNLTLMLAILSLMEATITLPGIAGIALTLGMAVDANVLIYERMREENKQQNLKQIIHKGYEMALRTILDSNITTVIVALLLYVFGSSAIKGFAITLIIGILCSMITAVLFTKVFVQSWYEIFRPKKLNI